MRADWERIPWHARWQMEERARRIRRSESVADQARRILAGLAPDPHAAEHVTAIDYYTAHPRKRTA